MPTNDQSQEKAPQEPTEGPTAPEGQSPVLETGPTGEAPVASVVEEPETSEQMLVRASVEVAALKVRMDATLARIDAALGSGWSAERFLGRPPNGVWPTPGQAPAKAAEGSDAA